MDAALGARRAALRVRLVLRVYVVRAAVVRRAARGFEALVRVHVAGHLPRSAADELTAVRFLASTTITSVIVALVAVVRSRRGRTCGAQRRWVRVLGQGWRVTTGVAAMRLMSSSAD